MLIIMLDTVLGIVLATVLGNVYPMPILLVNTGFFEGRHRVRHRVSYCVRYCVRHRVRWRVGDLF